MVLEFVLVVGVGVEAVVGVGVEVEFGVGLLYSAGVSDAVVLIVAVHRLVAADSIAFALLDVIIDGIVEGLLIFVHKRSFGLVE